MYIVKQEFRPLWSLVFDTADDSYWRVTITEIQRMAQMWGMSVDTIMEQVDEI